jgi:ArsR family transcriptional regulator, lead/cadmium/zinc/bismuth-responsive transcriptional repressor
MLNSDQTTELSELFRLLGELNRLAIVISCLDGPLSVGDITARLTLSQLARAPEFLVRRQPVQ